MIKHKRGSLENILLMITLLVLILGIVLTTNHNDFSKWPKKITLRKRIGNIFRERSRWSFPRYTSIKVKLLGRFHRKKIDWKHEGWR